MMFSSIGQSNVKLLYFFLLFLSVKNGQHSANQQANQQEKYANQQAKYDNQQENLFKIYKRQQFPIRTWRTTAQRQRTTAGIACPSSIMSYVSANLNLGHTCLSEFILHVVSIIPAEWIPYIRLFGWIQLKAFITTCREHTFLQAYCIILVFSLGICGFV